MSQEWSQAWQQHISDIRECGYEKSSTRLRTLIKSGLLGFTDMRDNPSKFFAAHRMLVDPKNRGPGFWIRFTVQYNLFVGTVLGLGGPEQVASLADMQKKGELGCFGLTERLAGVNSGLVVNTTATWQPSSQSWLINSASSGAYKNWISQGLTADKCALIADLIIEGKSHGPHGFLMDFRREGKVVTGVVLGDMGRKTTGNDLDNAWIHFDNVILPKTALLNRFADVVDNKYVQTTDQPMRIEVIGQRLLTGRVAVAQAGLAFTRKLYAMTKTYTDQKRCWAPNGEPVLGSIPHVSALLSEADDTLRKLDRYCALVEKDLSVCLKANTIPDKALVERIAVAKVMAIETSISLCFQLKQEVGSYALMAGTGFEHMDFLQCCKFAEGDSRILMQKMARDAVKKYRSSPPDDVKMAEYVAVLQAAGKKGWSDEWRTVYALAHLVMQHTIQDVTGARMAPLARL